VDCRGNVQDTWALLDASGHARRFVYIETPGFTPTQRDYAAAGESVPPYAADLIAALAARLLDASTTATLVGVIREFQRETGAGVLAISHDTLLLDRWATVRSVWRT
jgi:ABC-type oligopeptide transport system ATPase subunit